MVLAYVISTAFVGIAAGIGYAFDKFDVEEHLYATLPPQLQDPSILLALIVASLYWLNMTLMSGVGSVRVATKIQPPITYPTPKDVTVFVLLNSFRSEKKPSKKPI
jgi:hypothetical protein